ncbi:MAG TPA: FkbM family methyltransferase [Gammaproteobacteria bacterium]|nr:FkbM family methyltransferase [Gammaproteobacteria bacterium]
MRKVSPRPNAFVLASTEHGTMILNRHDYRLIDGGGYGVGYQLLANSAYDPDEVTAVLMLLEKRRRNFGDGVVAIDCGANIGVHTVEWARFMHGWGEVLSIEAQERVFYALAGNISLNNCFNARAVWAAVGATEGEIEVPVPNYLSPASYGSLEIRKRPNTEFIGQEIDYSAGRGIGTRMITLDGLGLARVDLVKVDVEGMEIEVLEGAKQCLGRMKPLLLVERIKCDAGALQELLLGFGYSVLPLGLNFLAIHESDPTAREVRVKK